MASSQMLIDSIAKVFGHISELIRFVSMFMVCNQKVEKVCNRKGTQVIAVRFGVICSSGHSRREGTASSHCTGKLAKRLENSKEVGK